MEKAVLIFHAFIDQSELVTMKASSLLLLQEGADDGGCGVGGDRSCVGRCCIGGDRCSIGGGSIDGACVGGVGSRHSCSRVGGGQWSSSRVGGGQWCCGIGSHRSCRSGIGGRTNQRCGGVGGNGCCKVASLGDSHAESQADEELRKSNGRSVKD